MHRGVGLFDFLWLAAGASAPSCAPAGPTLGKGEGRPGPLSKVTRGNWQIIVCQDGGNCRSFSCDWPLNNDIKDWLQPADCRLDHHQDRPARLKVLHVRCATSTPGLIRSCEAGDAILSTLIIIPSGRRGWQAESSTVHVGLFILSRPAIWMKAPTGSATGVTLKRTASRGPGSLFGPSIVLSTIDRRSWRLQRRHCSQGRRSKLKEVDSTHKECER